MAWLTGTSGFSYKEWKGSFYPEEIRPAEMLAYYAGRLGAVEINNTFYRMPKREVLASWAGQVPHGFRFVLKASRRITHFKKLVGAQGELGYLLENVGELGDRLGALFFQLPPFLKKDADRLGAFLEQLPAGGPRAAFEFRHPSWYDRDTFDALASSNVALVVADTGADHDPPFEPTADWGYLRLRREAYTDGELAEWVRRIRGSDWSDAFVFFKHEDEAAGPRLAERFAALLESR